MASESKAIIDDWSGEANLHDMTETEERAFIQVGLDSVELHGTVSHKEAMRRIDGLLERLQSR